MATAAWADNDDSSVQAAARGTAAPSGTITFLFTDIEGSTRLLERLRASYADVLEDQRKLLRESFARWHGHEVDTQGDAFFVAFPRAADALRCAVDAQRAMSVWHWPEGVTVRVRMGLHTGEPALATTGYVGMDVHRAARIAGAAHGGQIVLSGTTRDLVSDELPPGLELRDVGSHRLKDLRGETRLYQVVTEGLQEDFPPLQTAAAEEPPPTPGDPPFRGLQAFEEADAALFFGREEVVARLVDELDGVRFLALVGASGSGKSSILRAGLIPALRGAQPAWRIHLLTPTAHPLEALAAAINQDASPADLARLTDDLRRDPRSLAHLLRPSAGRRARRERTLVAVDQLEEVFTLCRDEGDRAAFLANLAFACGLDENSARTAPTADRATVVVTLRADFYAYLAPYDLVRDAAAAAQAYVGPMSVAELRRAIEEPARLGDWTFVPGLVDLLLRDVGDEPGALPLLSHALLETWRRRRGTTLTLRSYAESGEVKGAIARTADRAYERELTDEQRVIARNLFLRLTELGEGTQDTRRRVRLAEVMPPDPVGASAVRAVIGVLADARLVTVGEDSVEVAHEALIREWPTLRAWIESDRETLRTRRRIADGAAEWERLARDDEALLRGTRLAEAVEILASNPTMFNETERRFAEASVARQARERMSRERARRTLTAAAVALAAVFFVLAAGAAVLWLRSEDQRARAEEQQVIAEEQRVIAEERAREANEQRRIALSRQLATDSGTSGIALDLSLLLAIEANRMGDTFEARASLLAAVVSQPRLLRYLRGHTDWILDVAFSPDGGTLASGSGDGTIILWDVDGGGPSGEPLSGHTGSVSSVAFSPDGLTLASGSDDGTIILWDVEGRVPLGEPLGGHTGSVSSVAFSPDGLTLASGSDDGTIILWDVEGPERVGVHLSADGATVRDAAFSPNGLRIASGSDDGTISLWDVERREQIGEPLSAHTAVVRSVAFKPDGLTIASGSNDGTISLWDVERREQIGEPLVGGFGRVGSLAFSPDGRKIAAGTQAGVVQLWDSEQSQLIDSLNPVRDTGAVRSVAFTADGKTLAAGSDGTVILWDVDRRISIGEPLVAGRVVNRVALSGDDLTLASAGTGGIILWDLGTREEIGRLAQAGDATSVAISPDGKMVAAGGNDGSINLWEFGGAQLGTLSQGATVTSLAFSPDGATLVAAGSDGSMILWDTRPDSWRQMACQVANRDLTTEEWTHYLGTEEYRATCTGQ